jgi:hypothetical protein
MPRMSSGGSHIPVPDPPPIDGVFPRRPEGVRDATGGYRCCAPPVRSIDDEVVLPQDAEPAPQGDPRKKPGTKVLQVGFTPGHGLRTSENSTRLKKMAVGLNVPFRRRPPHNCQQTRGRLNAAEPTSSGSNLARLNGWTKVNQFRAGTPGYTRGRIGSRSSAESPAPALSTDARKPRSAGCVGPPPLTYSRASSIDAGASGAKVPKKPELLSGENLSLSHTFFDTLNSNRVANRQGPGISRRSRPAAPQSSPNGVAMLLARGLPLLRAGSFLESAGCWATGSRNSSTANRSSYGVTTSA